MDIISGLPKETLSEILSYLLIKHAFGDIRTCCLVSKTFNSVASRILYHHITLSGVDHIGPAPELEVSLLRPGHQSLQHVRSITVDIRDPELYEIVWPDERYFYEDIALLQMAGLLNRLVERVGEDKIKALDVFLKAFGDAIKNEPQTSPVDIWSPKSVTAYNQDLSLEALTIYGIGTISISPIPAWEMCQQNYRMLKRLNFHGFMGPSVHGYYPNTIPGNDHLARAISGPLQLDALESLSFKDLKWDSRPEPNNSLDAFLSELEMGVFSACAGQNIKTVSFLDCGSTKMLTLGCARFLNHITNLTIEISGTLEYLETLLCKLSCGLSSLYVKWYPCPENRNWNHRLDRDPALGKVAFVKHSTTLKSLYLNKQSGHKFCVKGPVSAEGGDPLDLETISKFPLLEYLALPLDEPDSWNPGVVKFQTLKFIHFLEPFPLRPGTESGAIENFLRWLSPSHEEPNTGTVSKSVKLKALVTPSNWSPYGRSTPYLVYFRSCSEPFYFESPCRAFRELCYWHPDIEEFCMKGDTSFCPFKQDGGSPPTGRGEEFCMEGDIDTPFCKVCLALRPTNGEHSE
ncbi:hypothetical protein AOL_s00110g162 [Orbilia oligospora ATCC 24927]|uniref:F-box domain-containing protein n=1 Tax=Arthrobotrys oligospora (strain ATCC 24927 / CBS 115.81 / DSM 1491) TaxID=756982 RepID=G1XKZ2_ARTOA|nr:hypothetical protein AOL_s00110g162 [Orbilia oligospora ATCC 24927]EGX46338.1 hypothetical protein AOL_s00110g162 [Orbilia oligospora ATCC 24927]